MAIYMMREYNPSELCFTAEQTNSTITLNKSWSPALVSLETSTDWQTWSDYTFGTLITLTNIGDKVYWRNKSETVTRFSTSSSAFYRFVITGLVGASGDVNYLLCKNSTLSLETPSTRCFYRLFYGNAYLTSSPKLPATTLSVSCYLDMFRLCTQLSTLPELPAATLPNSCYQWMFQWCSNIKLSSTQTWDYQTPYRIPTEWTGTEGTQSVKSMFISTGGTVTWVAINTTYYTSNTVV